MILFFCTCNSSVIPFLYLETILRSLWVVCIKEWTFEKHLKLLHIFFCKTEGAVTVMSVKGDAAHFMGFLINL